MKHHRWLIGVVAVLLAVSATTYLAHYLIFHDAHHIFVFLVEDIAFMPIEVLLVALVIEWLRYYQHLQGAYPYIFSMFGNS